MQGNFSLSLGLQFNQFHPFWRKMYHGLCSTSGGLSLFQGIRTSILFSTILEYSEINLINLFSWSLVSLHVQISFGLTPIKFCARSFFKSSRTLTNWTNSFWQLIMLTGKCSYDVPPAIKFRYQLSTFPWDHEHTTESLCKVRANH